MLKFKTLKYTVKFILPLFLAVTAQADITLSIVNSSAMGGSASFGGGFQVSESSIVPSQHEKTVTVELQDLIAHFEQTYRIQQVYAAILVSDLTYAVQAAARCAAIGEAVDSSRPTDEQKVRCTGSQLKVLYEKMEELRQSLIIGNVTGYLNHFLRQLGIESFSCTKSRRLLASRKYSCEVQRAQPRSPTYQAHCKIHRGQNPEFDFTFGERDLVNTFSIRDPYVPTLAEASMLPREFCSHLRDESGVFITQNYEATTCLDAVPRSTVSQVYRVSREGFNVSSNQLKVEVYEEKQIYGMTSYGSTEQDRFFAGEVIYDLERLGPPRFVAGRGEVVALLNNYAQLSCVRVITSLLR